MRKGVKFGGDTDASYGISMGYDSESDGENEEVHPAKKAKKDQNPCDDFSAKNNPLLEVNDVQAFYNDSHHHVRDADNDSHLHLY